MRTRVLLSALLVLGALSTIETAAAASRVTVTPTEAHATQSPAALRRAERLRKRIKDVPTRTSRVGRSTAAEERRQARLLERSRTRRPVPTSDGRASVIKRVLELVNEARKEKGLHALSSHPILERTAQAYAEDMSARGFFGHDDPEGGGSYDRIVGGGYAKPTCDCSWTFGTGENLAKGQDTPEEAMEDWMASPGHRANILRDDFRDIGIGYSDGHWVQHFGVIDIKR